MLEKTIEQIKNVAKEYGVVSEYVPFVKLSAEECYSLMVYINNLEKKYNKALKRLAYFHPPCEEDEDFMDENVKYCSRNCGVDEEIFKKCWDKYIEWKVKK